MRALFFAVQHRLVETGTHQRVTEAGDIHERTDVRRIVGLRERIAQLPQRFRPERRHQQQALRLEHAAEAGEHGLDVVHPLQAQVGEQDVHRAVGQRQRARITTDLARHLHERIETLRCRTRLLQHRHGKI